MAKTSTSRFHSLGHSSVFSSIVVYADSRIAPFVWRSSPLSVVSQRFDEQKKKPEYKVKIWACP